MHGKAATSAKECRTRELWGESLWLGPCSSYVNNTRILYSYLRISENLYRRILSSYIHTVSTKTRKFQRQLQMCWSARASAFNISPDLSCMHRLFMTMKKTVSPRLTLISAQICKTAHCVIVRAASLHPRAN